MTHRGAETVIRKNIMEVDPKRTWINRITPHSKKMAHDKVDLILVTKQIMIKLICMNKTLLHALCRLM